MVTQARVLVLIHRINQDLWMDKMYINHHNYAPFCREVHDNFAPFYRACVPILHAEWLVFHPVPSGLRVCSPFCKCAALWAHSGRMGVCMGLARALLLATVPLWRGSSMADENYTQLLQRRMGYLYSSHTRNTFLFAEWVSFCRYM